MTFNPTPEEYHNWQVIRQYYQTLAQQTNADEAATKTRPLIEQAIKNNQIIPESLYYFDALVRFTRAAQTYRVSRALRGA